MQVPSRHVRAIFHGDPVWESKCLPNDPLFFSPSRSEWVILHNERIQFERVADRLEEVLLFQMTILYGRAGTSFNI